jgi:hypothetical protein
VGGNTGMLHVGQVEHHFYHTWTSDKCDGARRQGTHHHVSPIMEMWVPLARLQEHLEHWRWIACVDIGPPITAWASQVQMARNFATAATDHTAFQYHI